jgi:hypothetical protein
MNTENRFNWNKIDQEKGLEKRGFNHSVAMRSKWYFSTKKRKKLFMFHLNKSGAYFHMKEELKAVVVQVVRERFNRKSPFTDKQELQLFMSQVYVYLISQMHGVINNVNNFFILAI